MSKQAGKKKKYVAAFKAAAERRSSRLVEEGCEIREKTGRRFVEALVLASARLCRRLVGLLVCSAFPVRGFLGRARPRDERDTL
jgi:hypothetical protein